MKREQVCSRLGGAPNILPRVAYREVAVEESRCRPMESCNHGNTDGQVVHKVAVADVDVDPVRPRGEGCPHVGREVGGVGRECRRRDDRSRRARPEVLHRAAIGCGGRPRSGRHAAAERRGQRRVQRPVHLEQAAVLAVAVGVGQHDTVDRDHRRDGRADVRKGAGSRRGEDRAAEGGRVRVPGEAEGEVGHVRVDLQPQGRASDPAGDGDRGRGEARRALRLEDELGAKAHGLDEGAEDVRPRVLQREADERPAGERVGVRRPVALEVVERHEALAPGRERLGRPVELVVGGLRQEEAKPVDGAAGGGLSPLDDVEPLDHRVLVGAPDPGAVHRPAGHPEVKVGGAREERKLAVVDDPEADHANHRVRAALRDEEASGEAEVLGGALREPPHGLPRREHLLWPLGLEALEPEGAEQGRRPTAVGRVVPPHRRVAAGGAHPPRQVEVDEVLVLADVSGRLKDIRLVLLDPQRFRDHPLRGDRSSAS
mmetsp:Transcript_6023/g.14592  ORF Transcript_6023/g.14592 Transcript_6023/m.14592 type:complete len:486 (+) Transcript_6023:520-1977(+)